MTEFTNFLFDTSQWPPRWRCGNWTEALGYTHIISDFLIFLAYFTIPCVLIYCFLKIKGFSLEKIFILFALFILFCGFGHLVEATIFYYPVYRFAGLVKGATAMVSWLTVFALVPFLKTFSDFPQLRIMNKELTEKLEEESEILKKVNEELQNSKKALEEFAYHAAHDLKEPVRGMGNFVTILLKTKENQFPVDVRDKLNKIQMLSVRSTEMIENMLKYSIDDLGLNQKGNIEIQSILNELIEEFEGIEEGVSIKIKGQLPSVIANTTALKEVLRNLICNGFKYNDKNEKIVEVGCNEDLLNFVIYVKDNGIGIGEDEKNKVFDLFYRGRHSIKNSSTGLGLGIAKKYVEKGGGTIWLESEIGLGTTFYFTVPRQ